MRAFDRPLHIFIAISLSVSALGIGGCARRSDTSDGDAVLTAASPTSEAGGNDSSDLPDNGEATSGSDTGPIARTHASPYPTRHGGTRNGGARNGGARNGGGGAPISIPDIIIRQGQDVYTLKQLIEKSAVSQCGYRCLKVQLADIDVTRLLSSYESFPSIIKAEDRDPPVYIVKRGTRIVLHGNQGAPDGPTDELPVSPSPSAGGPGE